MLGMAKYPRECVEACRARVARDAAAYDGLSHISDAYFAEIERKFV